MNWPAHGSNPQYIYEAMNLPKPNTWIDLSANINPLGPPKSILEKWLHFYESIGEYPDPFANALKEQIAQQAGVAKESILVGNGGAELIMLLGRMIAQKNVLIVQPTFSEYEKACQANGCHVFYHYLDEKWSLNLQGLIEKLDGVAAVFLCNPNNPTGVCFSLAEIQFLAEACTRKGIYLIIDEAFYDFWKDYEPLTPLQRTCENIILIRSMTKMYAIPGLRLGYLIASEEVVGQIAQYQPHWSVNVLAMLAGQECLKDEEFINQTIDYIEKERAKLSLFFTQEGFEMSPSKVNFYLLRDPELESQLPLFEFLLRHGIVPRHTMNFPGLGGEWLRFAIKSKTENDQLLQVLEEWRR